MGSRGKIGPLLSRILNTPLVGYETQVDHSAYDMGLIRNYAQYHADQRSQLGGRSDNHYHVLLLSIISVCDVVHPSGDCFTPAELIRYADYVGERKRRTPLNVTTLEQNPPPSRS